MRGCALRKVVRNLAHKKLENRGVEPQHLPSQIPRPAPTGWPPVGWWMAEKPGAEGSPRSPGEKLPLSCWSSTSSSSRLDRRRPSMRHMASIAIGNSIGGVPRCGTWPASVSSSSGTEPSTRRMLWHGRRWHQRRRLPSMWHLASIGIGIGGIHRCGSWPASVSSSSGTLDAAHALAWPALASASTTSTRQWAVGVGRSDTARCCVRSTAIASRRREAVRAHLGSVDAAKSTSLVARRVASLSRRRDAAVRYRALEGPRPLSICREAGQGVPLVYLPGLCRRSARACGVAASTAVQHIVGGNPSRQGEHVHHGGQQMC